MAYTADPRVDEYIDALPHWQQDICPELPGTFTPAPPPKAKPTTTKPKPTTTKPKPTTTTTTTKPKPVYYANCAAARAAGAAPLHRGEAGYRDQLDRDGDGVACETG